MTDAAPEALPESVLRTIIQDAAIGVWMIDDASRTRFANPHMAAMLGYTVEEMLGRPLEDFIGPQQLPFKGWQHPAQESGSSHSYEFTFHRKDGTPLYAEVFGNPVRDAALGFAGSLAFVQDAGRRQAAEYKLAASELAYRAVFESSQAIQLMIDPGNGHILAANKAARDFYGYSAEEFSELSLPHLTASPSSHLQDEWLHAKRSQRSAAQTRHRLKSGELRDVAVLSAVLQVHGCELLISTISDLGSQLAIERQLKMTQFTVDQSMHAIVWIGRNGIIRYANQQAGELAGLPPEQLVGMAGWRFDLSTDQAGWRLFWGNIKSQAHGRTSFRTRILNQRGAHLLIEAHAHYLHFEGDEFLVIHARDVTERVQAEALLDLQRNTLETAATGISLPVVLENLVQEVEQMAPDAVCSVLLLDSDGRLRNGASPSLAENFVRTIENLAIGDHAGTCGEAAYFGRAVETPDIALDPSWELLRSPALEAGLRACWAVPIRARDSRVLGTFAFYFRQPGGPGHFHRQIVDACAHLCGIAIEQRESESRIHALAFFDALTGLPNRALLADRVQLALMLAEREGFETALLFVDLDRFKTINDSLGHAVGDRFLQVIARHFQSALRESDTLCRLGGDEFVVLLPDCNAAGAIVVAEKLIAVASEEIVIDGRSMRAGASIGIAMHPEDASDYDTLMRNADTAMYQAKAAGRNGYRFFQRNMNESLSERLVLEIALRHAIKHNELSLHFQPQLHLESLKLYGAEALVRWQHPEMGPVSPAVFVTLAEECGLIDALGYWVLEEACRQMAIWQQQGIFVPAVSVNLSPEQFRQPNMQQKISDTLARHGLTPAQIRLEITEGLMMRDSEATLQSLNALDEMGFKLAVDDFGTGYSSLSYLKRFPVSELKLDQTFVRDLGEDPDDRALASAVISIGQSLSMTVVAEGVENRTQLEFLRRQRCDVVQGYLFGRPMPPDEFAAWVRIPR